MPAAMPRIANPVVTVEESFMFSNGKSPVRINHIPNKSIPRFLPAKLLVNAMPYPSFLCDQYLSRGELANSGVAILRTDFMDACPPQGPSPQNLFRGKDNRKNDLSVVILD